MGKLDKFGKSEKKLLEGKQNKVLPTAIIDPKTNKLVVNKDSIKEVTLTYFVDTLTSNTPEAGFENIIKEKK